MTNKKKQDRVQDADVKRLNHVGLGLQAIAKRLGCHPATVTIRLQELGVQPNDTRRSFMEQVFDSLTPEEQEWLSHNLYNSGIGIKEFVVTLLREAFTQAPVTVAAAPAPMPEMSGGEPKGPADVAPEDKKLFHETVQASEAAPVIEQAVIPEIIIGGSSPSPSPDDMVDPEPVPDATVPAVVPPPPAKIFG